MGSSTEVEVIKSAKKPHQCTWCGERIEVGSTYSRYRYFQHGDAGTSRMHNECLQAMYDAADDEGGWLEFVPFDNERPVTHNAD